jgi:hypothetical protein
MKSYGVDTYGKRMDSTAARSIKLRLDDPWLQLADINTRVLFVLQDPRPNIIRLVRISFVREAIIPS